MKFRHISLYLLTALSWQPCFAQPNTAHIPGDIPDGTSLPPELAKPQFVVPARDVLSSVTRIQPDGSKMTIQQIKPIALPKSRVIAAPSLENDSSFSEKISAENAAHLRNELLFVSATVFQSQEGEPARTLVSILAQSDEQGENEEITFWSSADFALLSGFSSFVGSDGEMRSLMMSWDYQMLGEKGDQADVLKIPNFPAGKATFQITKGIPSAELLASIQSLHDVYHNEYDRLKVAYEGREQARLHSEAALKANPPKPKDFTLNCWHIDSAAISEKGAAR